MLSNRAVVRSRDRIVRVLSYFLSVLFALPCAAFALFILTIDHVIVTRNVFVILYHFLLAFGWGVPALAITVVVLVVCGFFAATRFWASALIIALNIASLAVILMSPAAPRQLSEVVFLLPVVASVFLAAFAFRRLPTAHAVYEIPS
jgi:hypothetical protein